MNFNNKIALITSAGQGIGRAIANRLALDVTAIVINYRGNSEVHDEFVAELTNKGFKASAFRADVSKDAERRALIKHVVDAFEVIDILVNNAGIEHFGKLEDITEEDFLRVFSINVAGQLFVTQAASPHIPRGGRIVMTSSISARRAVLNQTLYGASYITGSTLAVDGGTY